MSKETTTKTNSGSEKGWSVPIWVAVVTGIVTVAVAIIGLIGTLAGVWASIKATDAPPPVPEAIPAFTASATLSESPTQVPAYTESIVIPFTTITTTPTSSSGIMYVILTANQTRGRPPLDVTLDARDSYFISTDGIRFECGACNYTWRIRTGGVDIYGPEKTDGRLQYIFGGRGNYFVSVYVCRSGSDTDCGGSGTQIVVE